MSYGEIKTALRKLQHWQQVAFSVACAERISPAFRYSAAPESVALYDAGLELAWRAAAGECVESEAEQLQLKFADIPEATVEDSGLPQWEAMEAAAILDAALRGIQYDDPMLSIDACAQALDMLPSFDYVLADPSSRAAMDELNGPHQEGPFEAREMRFQEETIRLLSSGQRDRAELVGLLRQLSKDAARDFEPVIPEFYRRNEELMRDDEA